MSQSSRETPPSSDSRSDSEDDDDGEQDNTMRNRFLLGLLALLIVGGLVGLIIWLVNITSDDDSSGGTPSDENKVHGCNFVKWNVLQDATGGTLNSGGRGEINHVNIDKQLYSWANGVLQKSGTSMPSVSEDPDEIITYQESLQPDGKTIEIIPTLSRIPGDFVDYRNNESAFNIPLPQTSDNILAPSDVRPVVSRGYALGNQNNAFWVSYRNNVNMCTGVGVTSETPDVLILVDEEANQTESHSFDISHIEQVEIRSWVIGGAPAMAFISRKTPTNENTQLYVTNSNGELQEVTPEDGARFFQYVSNWSTTGNGAFIYASDTNNEIYAIDSGQVYSNKMTNIMIDTDETIVGLQVFNNGKSLLITTTTGLRIVDVSSDNGSNSAINIDGVIGKAVNDAPIKSARAVALPSNKLGLVYLTDKHESKYSVLSCSE